MTDFFGEAKKRREEEEAKMLARNLAERDELAEQIQAHKKHFRQFFEPVEAEFKAFAANVQANRGAADIRDRGMSLNGQLSQAWVELTFALNTNDVTDLKVHRYFVRASISRRRLALVTKVANPGSTTMADQFFIGPAEIEPSANFQVAITDYLIDLAGKVSR